MVVLVCHLPSTRVCTYLHNATPLVQSLFAIATFSTQNENNSFVWCYIYFVIVKRFGRCCCCCCCSRIFAMLYSSSLLLEFYSFDRNPLPIWSTSKYLIEMNKRCIENWGTGFYSLFWDWLWPCLISDSTRISNEFKIWLTNLGYYFSAF